MSPKTILADRKNMVYMGTVVEEGRAEALVMEPAWSRNWVR